MGQQSSAPQDKRRQPSVTGFSGAAHRVIFEGLPICTAVEHRRPANDAESLAFLYLHVQMDGMRLEQHQQSYVDERKNV